MEDYGGTFWKTTRSHSWSPRLVHSSPFFQEKNVPHILRQPEASGNSAKSFQLFHGCAACSFQMFNVAAACLNSPWFGRKFPGPCPEKCPGHLEYYCLKTRHCMRTLHGSKNVKQQCLVSPIQQHTCITKSRLLEHSCPSLPFISQVLLMMDRTQCTSCDNMPSLVVNSIAPPAPQLKRRHRSAIVPQSLPPRNCQTQAPTVWNLARSQRGDTLSIQKGQLIWCHQLAEQWSFRVFV